MQRSISLYQELPLLYMPIATLIVLIVEELKTDYYYYDNPNSY